MRTAPRTALIAAGPVSESWVARLPGLRQGLQYVKSGSLRVASRIANNLRAGEAVEFYEDLRHADLLLIAVPFDELESTLQELQAASLRWKRHAVVLCGNRVDTASLMPLRGFGAQVGSLDLMDGYDEARFLFEGDRAVLLKLKRLVEAQGRAKIIEMEERRRAVYEAGLTFANGMTFQMLAAGIEAMRSAGLTDKQAFVAVETAVMRALRGYVAAGRKGWTGPLAEGDRVELGRQYHALREANPQLAEVFLALAIEYLLERGAELGKRSTKADVSERKKTKR